MGFEQYAIHLIRSNRNLQKRNSKHYFKQKTTDISEKEKPKYLEKYIGEDKDFSNAIYQKRLAVFKQLLLFVVLLIIFLVYGWKYADRKIVEIDNNYNKKLELIAENTLQHSTNSVVYTYHFYVRYGSMDLAAGKYTLAKNQFIKALDLFPKGKAANIGLTRCLQLICKRDGKYCKRANKYLVFLKKSNALSQKELEKIENY